MTEDAQQQLLHNCITLIRTDKVSYYVPALNILNTNTLY